MEYFGFSVSSLIQGEGWIYFLCPLTGGVHLGEAESRQLFTLMQSCTGPFDTNPICVKKNVNLIWLACKLKWIPYDLYLPEVSFTRKLLKLVLNQLMGKCSEMTCIEKLYLETMNNLQCNQSFDYIWTPKVLYEKNAFELSWLYRWSQHVVVMANH